MQTHSDSLENNIEIPKNNLEVELPYDSAWEYIQGLNNSMQKGISTPIFMVALFIRARI